MKKFNFDFEWNKLREILKKNDNFNAEELMYIKIVKKVLNNNFEIIRKSDVLYRARKMKAEKFSFDREVVLNYLEYCVANGDNPEILKKVNSFRNKEGGVYNTRIDEINSGFLGYNKKDSSAPQSNQVTKPGRANRIKQSCLYLSKDKETCINEVDPKIDNWVSIGIFKALKDLRIVKIVCDESTFQKYQGDEYLKVKELLVCLSSAFSLPVENEDDYIITQYLSEMIKKMGYDGLVYKSAKCNKGKCYVIFNPENFDCESSELCMVKKVNYDTSEYFKVRKDYY